MTLASASAAVAPPSTSAAISVVSGVKTVDPSGARSTPSKASLVAASRPPVITREPLAPTRVKAPLVPVVVDTSPASSTPLPLASAKTVAPST